MRVIAGIFIGGAATRFGGIAKGMLPAPDGSGSITLRLVNLCLAIHAEPIFVGPREDPRYSSVSQQTVIDRPGGLGPLGGMLALYDHAERMRSHRVIALACDMPFVTRETLEKLRDCEAPIAACKRDGRWEPFISVHDPRIMRPRAEANGAAGRLSLQALFEGALELAIDPHELDDWDTPEDAGGVVATMPMRTMSKK